MDIGLERIETKAEKVQEDLERKRKDIEGVKEKQTAADDVIAKLVAAIAVLEGQVNQQRQLIDHRQILIDHAQTIATRAIKHTQLSPSNTDSSNPIAEAGPSRITPSHTLRYPLQRTSQQGTPVQASWRP